MALPLAIIQLTIKLGNVSTATLRNHRNTIEHHPSTCADVAVISPSLFALTIPGANSANIFRDFQSGKLHCSLDNPSIPVRTRVDRCDGPPPRTFDVSPPRSGHIPENSVRPPGLVLLHAVRQIAKGFRALDGLSRSHRSPSNAGVSSGKVFCFAIFPEGC